MSAELLLFVGLYLALLSYLDIKHREIPSILLTSMILLLAIFAVFRDPTYITFGILSLIFGWLLWDFDYIRGIADIKAIVIVGLILTSLNQFFAFMLLTVIIGATYFVIMKKLLKVKDKEIPFIPVFFFVFVVLVLIF